MLFVRKRKSSAKLMELNIILSDRPDFEKKKALSHPYGT